MSEVRPAQPALPATPAAPAGPRGLDRPLAAFAGIVGVGAALGVGELASGLVPGVPSPVLAMSRLIVDYQPPGAKDFVVAIFGTGDKLALQLLIVIVGLAVGAAIGILGRTRSALPSIVIGAFAAAGFIAALRDPDVSPLLAAIAAGVEVIVGSTILGWLLTPAPAPAAARPRPSAAKGKRGVVVTRRTTMPDWTRRRLLQRGGAVAVGSLAAGVVGRMLLDQSRAPLVVTNFPTPAKPATLPAGADIATADLTTDGLTPIVMPNDQFYRIDTAFITPGVDITSWTLKVSGMVDHPLTLTYDQLIQLPIIEQYVTIACVSNEVGGNLVGNAAWRGVPLRTVLDMAGVQNGATQLVGHSVDGFTAGMPTAWVMDQSRTPMIAVGMNGQPLPHNHGYPARLIVPGLYGYVSATKWLSEIELTTLEAFDAYWVALGWAKEGPILTQSRIDVPHDGAGLAAGNQPIAGVAWAPDRGVKAVEVSIDQGPWQACKLSAPISDATWVQWLLAWNAPSGNHQISVRATDDTGAVQTDQMTPPFPDGARGHHTINVHVG